jgi:hypothetical protein
MDKNGRKFSFESEIFLPFYYTPPARLLFIAMNIDEE